MTPAPPHDDALPSAADGRERIVVVGGGITGLTLGHRLAALAGREASAPEITVLESEARPGGHSTTLAEDGFLVEAGPNGFLDRWREPQTRALVRELGLEPRLHEARAESKRRYVLLGGRLRLVPAGPSSLIGSDILSPRGKLRLMMEPFVGRARDGSEETVWEFAARRIGREAADHLVDAAVSGISAGDSRELAVASAFPLMTEMEREHGSLVRAMIARRRQPVPRIFSFDGGLSTLIDALAARLGPRLRTGAAVRSLARGPRGWRLRIAGGEEIEAERVALTVPSHAAARLVEGLDRALAAELETIPFAGVAMVALAYHERALPRPLDGYGYLVARDEGLDTLGVVWESSLFEGRAPRGMALLRCMLGGMRRPGLAERDPADLVARARRELAPVLGITAAPARVWVRAFPRGIAQYVRGHAARIAGLRARAAAHPGLHLIGTSYDGISFTAAVAAAERAAAALLESPARSAAPRATAAPSEVGSRT